MAAQQAASNSPDVTEATGRFDAIRIDRIRVEVKLPGYDFAKAQARAQQRFRKRATAQVSAAPPAQPVVFGSGACGAAVGPIPQPSSGLTGLDLHLEL